MRIAFALAVAAIGWSNGAGNLILLAAEHPESVTTAIFLHGVASFTAEDARQWAEQNSSS
jgi:predicted esterase